MALFDYTRLVEAASALRALDPWNVAGDCLLAGFAGSLLNGLRGPGLGEAARVSAGNGPLVWAGWCGVGRAQPDFR